MGTSVTKETGAKGANYKHHLYFKKNTFLIYQKRILKLNKAFEWLLEKNVTSTNKKNSNRIYLENGKRKREKKTSKWKINVKIKLDVMLGIYPLSFVTEYAWCTTHWQRRKQQRGRYTLEHVVVNSKTKKKKVKN